MNINKFNTIGYFIACYFNWSMDWSELESCVEDFLIRENEEKIETFKKEIEEMYMLNDSDLIREVAYRLGNRGMPTDKALSLRRQRRHGGKFGSKLSNYESICVKARREV